MLIYRGRYANLLIIEQCVLVFRGGCATLKRLVCYIEKAGMLIYRGGYANLQIIEQFVLIYRGKCGCMVLYRCMCANLQSPVCYLQYTINRIFTIWTTLSPLKPLVSDPLKPRSFIIFKLISKIHHKIQPIFEILNVYFNIRNIYIYLAQGYWYKISQGYNAGSNSS